MPQWFNQQARADRRRPLSLDFIASGVFLSGFLAIVGVLFSQIRQHGGIPVVSADARVTLFVGLSLIYLASLLRRGKHTAWLISLPLYVYLIVRNIQHYDFDISPHANPLPVLLNLLVPAFTLLGLIVFRQQFKVKSEVLNIAAGLRWAAIIISTALVFGILGFQLMDERDFHRELSIPTSIHYTVDQFNLTTSQPLVAYSHRASLFLDSLRLVSLTSLVYVGLSLFAPIRFRLSSQDREHKLTRILLETEPADSEDFFKLWPRDKAYFINDWQTVAIAYRTVGGVALSMGDPAGRQSHFASAIEQFEQYTKANDWNPAFIHTRPKTASIYKKLGYDLQKIGEEAIVSVEQFAQLKTGKYFRNIINRFAKQKISCEMLLPPHSPALLNRLREISNDWLAMPGRSERGFVMGYFDESYLQQCPVMIARDEAGQIQAFLNQVPSFDSSEANFDMMRVANQAPPNTNDFLLINFIDHLGKQGFKTLNMGLSPLVGLKDSAAGQPAINNLLHLIYSSGNRFYSFKGLEKFKSKYQPNWQDRYVVYRGGTAGFIRTMNALIRAMKVKH